MKFKALAVAYLLTKLLLLAMLLTRLEGRRLMRSHRRTLVKDV
jgi:hypothetical protein